MRRVENSLANTGAILGITMFAPFMTFTGLQWIGYLLLVGASVLISAATGVSFVYAILIIVAAVVLLQLFGSLFGLAIYLGIAIFVGALFKIHPLILFLLIFFIFWAYCYACCRTKVVVLYGVQFPTSTLHNAYNLLGLVLIILGAAYFWEFNLFNLTVTPIHFLLWLFTGVPVDRLLDEETSEAQAHFWKFVLACFLTYWFFAILGGI